VGNRGLNELTMAGTRKILNQTCDSPILIFFGFRQESGVEEGTTKNYQGLRAIGTEKGKIKVGSDLLLYAKYYYVGWKYGACNKKIRLFSVRSGAA